MKTNEQILEKHIDLMNERIDDLDAISTIQNQKEIIKQDLKGCRNQKN